MTHVHHHLQHAINVMKAERDWRKWGPLIDALPDEAREPCRAWLREEARKRQTFAKYQAGRTYG